MSVEMGMVQRVENGWAWVQTDRKTGCDQCGHKGSCNMIEGADHMLIKAANSARARVGDSVEVFLSTRTRMKSLLILYVLPVIGLLAGALSGGGLSRAVGLNENLGTVFFTFIGLALAFLIVRMLSSHMASRQELTPIVSRIMRRAGTGLSHGEARMTRPTDTLPRGGQCCSS